MTMMCDIPLESVATIDTTAIATATTTTATTTITTSSCITSPPSPLSTISNNATASGFRNLVRRIQFAARFAAKTNNDELENVYQEDMKLNTYVKGTSIRRRRHQSVSIPPPPSQPSQQSSSTATAIGPKLSQISLAGLPPALQPSSSSTETNHRYRKESTFSTTLIPGSSGGIHSGRKRSLRPSYITGEIKFLNEDNDVELKPFATIDTNISVENVAHIFKNIWRLEMPKIITFVVTSQTHNYCQWQNKKQIKHFQIGIAKAAMSTNMWLLTNGLNCGATGYICSAIENEVKKNKLKNFSKMDNIPLLFGITHLSDLVYGDKLTTVDYQKVRDKIKNLVYIENQGYTPITNIATAATPTNDDYLVDDDNGEVDGPDHDGDEHRHRRRRKFELNTNHSHYIIVKNRPNDMPGEFMLKLVNMLIKGEQFYQIYNKTESIEIPLVSMLIEGEPDNLRMVLNLIRKQIPVVVLHGSGGLADLLAYAYFHIWSTFPDVSTWDAEYIEDCLKPMLAKKIRLQFARSHTTTSVNTLVRNILRDQLIECVRIARQEGREYLIILDMHNLNTCNLENLSEHLLNALLKSRRDSHQCTYEQMLKDFDLIMDWNCADVARNLLFSSAAQNSASNITERFRSKFFQALTRASREQFVEIFLCNGFQVHKFMTPSRLNRLFRIIHDDDFFHTVCWESTLGQSSTAKQSTYFIENELNWLIEFCTGLENFINPSVLHCNSLGIYRTDVYSAERKALTILAIWAVMHNRYELVRVLWKHSDHPVHLGLIISMLFERLSWHVLDTNLKAELRQKSSQFAAYANGVLDQCYNENISQAYNVLRESIQDWNYMTAVDIAANARLKQFLAHPCCQRWLTSMFQGKIRLRDITWGFFTIPVPLKILLCSLLVFPMYIWVRFKYDDQCELSQQSSSSSSDGDEEENENANSRNTRNSGNVGNTGMRGGSDEDELDVYQNIYTNHAMEFDDLDDDYDNDPMMDDDTMIHGLGPSGCSGMGQYVCSSSASKANGKCATAAYHHNNNNNNNNRKQQKHQKQPNDNDPCGHHHNHHNHNHHHHREVFVRKQPPLWMMVKMMWCSPITKFYTSQLFYILFLIILSLSTLYPNCGSLALDSIVCLWTFLVGISYTRQVYLLVLKYSSISIYSKILEILLIFLFAVEFLLTRICGVHFYPVYWQKVILSLALLYFYYRLISIYLPISPTLGPLLHRFRLMITVDFVNYMRITLVLLISNGIVIHALQYPFQTLTIETISTVLHQGYLSLFYGPPHEITVKYDPQNQQKYCPSDSWMISKSTDNITKPIMDIFNIGGDGDEEDEVDYPFTPSPSSNNTNTTTSSPSPSLGPSSSTVVEHTSLILYIFVYQYFIIMKLIVGPLLFSIFSVTASKWVTEIDYIWKFQRYHLVIDFANRLPLPEPFSLFYYIYRICTYLYQYLANIFTAGAGAGVGGIPMNRKKSSAHLPPDHHHHHHHHNQPPQHRVHVISPEDCLYWKQLASEYLDKESRNGEQSNLLYKAWENIQEISLEMEYEKRMLREIKGKLMEMEKNFQLKLSYDECRNFVGDIDGGGDGDSSGNGGGGGGGGKKEEYKPLSRLSPYPDTTINRYPIARKYTSWQVDYFAYDPVCYTKPMNQFEAKTRFLVDEDILRLREHLQRHGNTNNEFPIMKWNDKQLDKKGYLVDRRSWCLSSSTKSTSTSTTTTTTTTTYQLEDNFLPLNPFGRTGLRGKGANRRWGPNHHFIIVIAHSIGDQMGHKKTKILFEMAPLNRLFLIERYVNNESEIYQYMCKKFQLEPLSSGGSVNQNQNPIEEIQTKLNAKWIQPHPTTATTTTTTTQSIELKLIHAGYWDDPQNTDNAWKEVNLYLLRFNNYNDGGDHHFSSSSPLSNINRSSRIITTTTTTTNTFSSSSSSVPSSSSSSFSFVNIIPSSPTSPSPPPLLSPPFAVDNDDDDSGHAVGVGGSSGGGSGSSGNNNNNNRSTATAAASTTQLVWQPLTEQCMIKLTITHAHAIELVSPYLL